MKTNAVTKDLCSFIAASPTSFHAVAEAERRLKDAGYKSWTPDAPAAFGEKLYYAPSATCLFAFAIGGKPAKNKGLKLRLAGAHTDSPCLHIKPDPDMSNKQYLRLNVDVYGGPIVNTWLDRPLSIAGRIAVKDEKTKKPVIRLFDAKDPVLSIPNLAIHMNREVNKGVELNRQTDILPLLGLSENGTDTKGTFVKFLAGKLKCKPENIIDFDLFVYNTEAASIQGLNGEFLTSPRLDDLTSCHALLEAMKETPAAGTLNIAAFYNNEEIGSNTANGADSRTLPMVLENLYDALSLSHSTLNADILNGTLLSLDVAHALHPNMTGKYDPQVFALMGDGVVFKLNSCQKYINDLEVLAELEVLCETKKIPYKKFVNRSDVAGGGTIGNMLASWLPMKGLDMGVPILSMHSSRETMGVTDQDALVKLLCAFFGSK